MTFLNDFLETRQTVSSLPDVAERYGTFESYEDDSNTALGFTNSFPSTQTTIDASPPMLTPTCVPLRMPSPTLVPPRISTPRSVSPETPFSTTSRKSATNTKKQKTDALQTALIEASTTQTADPLDGFLVRLGEGMRMIIAISRESSSGNTIFDVAQ